MSKFNFLLIPVLFVSLIIASCGSSPQKKGVCISDTREVVFDVCAETKESTTGVDRWSMTLNGSVTAKGTVRLQVHFEISSSDEFREGEVGIVGVASFDFGELNSFEFSQLLYSGDTPYFYRVVVIYEYLDFNTGLSSRGVLYGNTMLVEPETGELGIPKG